MSAEARIHDQWAHLTLGGEWFRATRDLLTWAEALA